MHQSNKLRLTDMSKLASCEKFTVLATSSMETNVRRQRRTNWICFGHATFPNILQFEVKLVVLLKPNSLCSARILTCHHTRRTPMLPPARRALKERFQMYNLRKKLEYFICRTQCLCVYRACRPRPCASRGSAIGGMGKMLARPGGADPGVPLREIYTSSARYCRAHFFKTPPHR